jgi:hypothetical protein
MTGLLAATGSIASRFASFGVANARGFVNNRN